MLPPMEMTTGEPSELKVLFESGPLLLTLKLVQSICVLHITAAVLPPFTELPALTFYYPAPLSPTPNQQ
jgi:hypothetical protein